MLDIFYTALKEDAFETAEMVLDQIKNELTVQELSKNSTILYGHNFYSWWYIRCCQSENQIDDNKKIMNSKSAQKINQLFQKTYHKTDQATLIKNVLSKDSIESFQLEQNYMLRLIRDNDEKTLKQCKFYDEKTNQMIDIGSHTILNMNFGIIDDFLEEFQKKDFSVQDFDYNLLSLFYERILRENKNLVFINQQDSIYREPHFNDLFERLLFRIPLSLMENCSMNQMMYNNISFDLLDSQIRYNIDYRFYSNFLETNEMDQIYYNLDLFIDQKSTEIKKYLKSIYQDYSHMDLKNDGLDRHILTKFFEDSKTNQGGSSNPWLLMINHYLQYPVDWLALDDEGKTPLTSYLSCFEKIRDLNDSDYKRFEKITNSVVDFLNSDHALQHIHSMLKTIQSSYKNNEKQYLNSDYLLIKELLIDDSPRFDWFSFKERIGHSNQSNELNNIEQTIDEIEVIKKQMNFYNQAQHCLDLINQINIIELPQSIQKPVPSRLKDNLELLQKIEEYGKNWGIEYFNMDDYDFLHFFNVLFEAKDNNFFKDEKNIGSRYITHSFQELFSNFLDLPNNIKQNDDMNKLFLTTCFFLKKNFYIENDDINSQNKRLKPTESTPQLNDVVNNNNINEWFQSKPTQNVYIDIKKLSNAYNDFFNNNQHIIQNSFKTSNKLKELSQFVDHTLLKDLSAEQNKNNTELVNQNSKKSKKKIL